MNKYKVYFVHVGSKGYLPDNSTMYPSLAQAIDAAKEEKAITLNGTVYKVQGDIRRDWVYEVINPEGITKYRWSILIEEQYVDDFSFEDYPGELNNRQDLAAYCDWYNEQY